MSIIEIENLSKHFKVLNRREGLLGAARDLFSGDYRTIKAVDDISLDIEAGEIVGYIGPNGAGKSTTLKMMTGILKPTSGSLLVNGNVPYENRQRNAQNIGVIFGQRTQLWWDLPVIESFKLIREIYGVDQAQYERQLELFNKLADVKSLYSQPVRNLSLGQRMLCDLVAAFLHSPRIVFLDEPTIGLDVSIKARMRDLIRELNRTHNITIILTTHDITDVEALCNRIVIIDKGRLLYDGETRRVSQLFGAFRTLKAHVEPFHADTVEQVHKTLSGRFGESDNLAVRSKEEGWVTITVNQDAIPLLEVLNLTMSSFGVKDIQIVEISLESIIRRLYEGTRL
jgi:ABC-2 type transport system ATP-binding protein